MTALRVDALACRRNGRLLFDGLSFDLAGGAALALTGPNGVGKTSLLRILAGLMRPEAGSARLEPADPELGLAGRALFVSSRDPLKSALTVAELVGGWRDILFPDEGGDVKAALEAFALTALSDTPCAWLSSGQRRRTSLARLGLSAPGQRPLWLLDEPTNALDAQARRLLARVCARHLEAGGMIVAATHDPLDWPGLRSLDLGAFAGAAEEPA